MFRKQDLKTARKFLWLMAVAAIVASCETEPELPPRPGPTQPPPDGYVWRELPEVPDNLPPMQGVATHRTVIGGKMRRNFTMLYDRNEKVAYWVAYPMHKIYFGSFSRLDNFVYDPFFPSSAQMPITSGGYGVRGYDRGHQIASADRTATREANDQTFYVTNMTPQNSTLNQGLWAGFESWVRSKANSGSRSDTLYVVTGCAIRTPDDTNVSYITKNGVRGAIPKAYYKVLLRTVSGEAKFPSDDDAMCIGMWIENRTPASGDDWRNYLMSVSEIERLTGHTFFPAISSSVKSTYSRTDWGIH